jgi:L-amino acid N-acyltransferase YncA
LPFIRAARRDDCAAMADIFNHYVVHDTCTYRTERESEEERAAWLAAHGPKHLALVVEAAGRVVGWASLSPFDPRGGCLHTVEDSIYLDPAWHGRGLGAALLGRLIDGAHAAGHRALIAIISAEQAASLALHERFGFKWAGRLPEVGWKHGRWLDLVFLHLDLGPGAKGLDDITIAREVPRTPEVLDLIHQLDAYLASLYPAESNHLLDVEALLAPDIRFFVARHGRRAVGCGALRVDPDGYGEVKRMFVPPGARGRDVGRRILACLEAQAREEALPLLRLETGVHQTAAIALYRSCGFTPRGPFAAYGPDPLSLFLEKPAAPRA